MMICVIWAVMWTTLPVFKASDGTAYALHGPQGAPAVVLIHGLGLSSQFWEAHLPALSARYRVLTYDLFGHETSAAAREDLSLKVFSEQISGMLQETALGPAHLVGFSIGGMINRRFAMDHPDMLRSLVIVNSPHDRGTDMQAAVEERARKAVDKGAMATMGAALDRWFTPEFLTSGTDAPARVTDWRLAADPVSYGQSAWVLAHGVRELIRPSPAIRHPALVITCENDTGSTPDMSHEIASEIAGAQSLIVPKLKHLGMMEDPEAFTAPILKFLNAQPFS